MIGFQGIFQYELADDGSGFSAEEVTPLVQSTDPNFRPVDIEVGPDGAVYFLDWQNPLIGPNDEKQGPRFPDMSEPYDR